MKNEFSPVQKKLMLVFGLIVCLSPFRVYPSQTQRFIANTFRFPIDGQLTLNGNYGEIRPNHFHAGIDLKTDAVKNLPIYSIEDGYVSRVKVSTTGYGKVLYVTHPNGYVSVYAHQHHFSKRIAEFVKQEQAQKETFEIEIFPKPEELQLKKGEVIGYTGNTGNSQGPHLHFEIREEKSEIPLNPLRFYKINDVVAPKIQGVFFYNLNNMEAPVVNKTIKPGADKTYSFTKEGRQWLMKNTMTVNSCFGLGISAFDTETLRGNVNQVYGVKVLLDEQPYVHYEFDGIAFDQARYVNCFSEQSNGLKQQKIQRCFLSQNEELPIFKIAQNNGEFILKDTLTHILKITVYDINGNEEVVVMNVKNSKTLAEPTRHNQLRSCLNEWQKESDYYRLLIPERTFYNDYSLRIENPAQKLNYQSRLLVLKGTSVPLFKALDIALKPIGAKQNLYDKLCVIETGTQSYCGGTVEEGMIKGQSKTLGTFALVYDTIAPSIKAMTGGKKNADVSRQSALSFLVSDNLSGIDRFRMEINGKWVNAEYEHKNNSIFYTFDAESTGGKLNIKLEVWDKKGNRNSCNRECVR